MREFIINENDGGQRLDKFISKLMPKLPKSMMYKGLRKNCVKINDRHIKDGSVFVKDGDTVKLYFRDEFFEKQSGFRYVRPRLDIVYEDDNIIIVNKAPGVVSHTDERGTETTLIGMIQSYLFENNEYNPESENSFAPALCGRLDRNTGGLVIAAKNAASLREMNKRVREREVKKYYMAVAEGYPNRTGKMEGFAKRDGTITKISADASEDAKRVSLKYRVIAQKNGFSLAEVLLDTGRTHQIRAQFAAAGYPLAGDTKYGGHGGMFRQALWSVKLVFDFADDEGVLGYLKGREFRVSAPFEKEFEENGL